MNDETMTEPSPKARPPLRVLCLDGGGILGAFTAGVLSGLMDRAQTDEERAAQAEGREKREGQLRFIRYDSAEFTARYRAAGAADFVTPVVAKGQGPNLWEGFFRCRKLVAFVIDRAHSGTLRPPPAVHGRQGP
jgi:hypothetical protein